MWTWVRKSPLVYWLITVAAFLLRLYFVRQFPVWHGDAEFYGELAANWLRHGVLGTTSLHGVQPCLIRLPGYPAFIAAIWAITGIGHYRSVLVVQMFLDVGTCYIVADLVRRVFGSERATKLAFLLAALCPFMANYVACALTETLAIFFAAAALDATAAAINSGSRGAWATTGVMVGAGLLLRPDGGILLPVIGCAALLFPLLLPSREQAGQPRSVRLRFGLTSATIFAGVALAPLVLWTMRNWHTFHVFQPLAPRYANAPSEYVPTGFQRWIKTWIVDYVSVSEIYWSLDEEPIDLSKAPQRAFDSPQQREVVAELFSQYGANPHPNWTQELDAKLNQIAKERIARHPWRYYLGLPLARSADMWLRPRTEMLGIEERWWEAEPKRERAISWALGGLNLAYLLGAVTGFVWLAWEFFQKRGTYSLVARHWGVWLGFLLVRSLFLGSLENPEPRYTLECYPVIIAASAAIWWSVESRRKTHRTALVPGRLGRAQFQVPGSGSLS